jgi:hypothetical protein
MEKIFEIIALKRRNKNLLKPLIIQMTDFQLKFNFIGSVRERINVDEIIETVFKKFEGRKLDLHRYNFLLSNEIKKEITKQKEGGENARLKYIVHGNIY